MLEQGSSLRTWALEQPLTFEAEVRCVALAEHRLAYLNYEGPVSEDRGSVTRIDQGEYTTVDDSADSIRVRLRGRKTSGELHLQRVSNFSEHDATDQSWVARLLPVSEA